MQNSDQKLKAFTWSCPTFQLVAVLNWRRTAIWKVEAWSVYRFLKQLVTTSPFDI